MRHAECVPPSSEFADAVRAHDQAVARTGLAVWVGAEPTFTDRYSEHAAWLFDALGADKQARARSLLAALAAHRPGAAVLRTVGRQYPGEPYPRWSIGLYARRDGAAWWPGPPDPLLAERCPPCGDEHLDRLCDALAAALDAQGWSCAVLGTDVAPSRRLVFRCDGARPCADPSLRPGLARGPLHDLALPRHGLSDELAADGLLLLAVYTEPLGSDGAPCACIELPAIGAVDAWLQLLGLVGRAARAAGLAAVVLRGFPPPVDASIAWTTLTPDPAVVEANHAPAHDAATFHAWSREIYDAAAVAGLAPHRLQYNGVVSDSGGAGHLTLGGPTPLDSPFFRVPQLLPRLIRYLSRHPSLSYYFAPVFLGGSGQSPRPDEGGGEAFAELEVALEQLDRASELDPSILAHSLAPFLVDPAGNPHRSELNIEKLWNPGLPGRGCLGLVEFRAFRMPPSPEHATALACLLRAVAAMLARAAVVPNLWRWGDALHDRFALPFYLQRDLHVVLADLFAAGLGLAAPIRERLLHDPARRLATATFDGVSVDIDQGLEFWPLVGDVASQETGGSRLVDASTARLQIVLRPLPGAQFGLDDWELGAEGRRVALRGERDAEGPLRVGGLRYRSFRPTLGLHPCLPARDRVELTLARRGSGRHLRLVVHAWRPDGEAYAGLPADLAEAAARRQERLHTTIVDDSAAALVDPPAAAVSPHCLDLRRL